MNDNALEVADGAKIVCGRVFNLDPDPEVVRFVNRYGGRNLYGDPLFRLVWGPQRRHWKMAVWHDKNEHGEVVRKVKECRFHFKYPRFAANWVLEWWKAPLEFGHGDPDKWAEQRGYKDAILGRIDSRRTSSRRGATTSVATSSAGTTRRRRT